MAQRQIFGILMQNIYELKNYKLLALIPIALLLLSLYFIPKIQLDSSLRGGITITLQSNTTMDTRALVSAINTKISGAEASVARAPGGLSITIASNQSISSAEADLLKAYSDYGNYTSEVVLISNINASLKQDPGNSTLTSMLKATELNASRSASALSSDIASEYSSLGVLTQGQTYNKTNPDSMVSSAAAVLNSANDAYKVKVVSALRSILPFTSYSYQIITPTLSSYFLSEMRDIIIFSFIAVAIVVLLIFRTGVPSFAVVFGAANDLLIALGAMGAFGIPLGVASIGGLLMLVGYSIDTDILSAMRILKRTDGTPESRALSTMKTGITMTTTALIVFSILFIVSYLSFIPTYFEISGVVLAGLAGDILATWFGNVVLILWYKKRKDGIK